MVYIETHRDSVFVDEAAIERMKTFFKSKGIAVAAVGSRTSSARQLLRARLSRS
jgi:hypothetical protein